MTLFDDDPLGMLRILSSPSKSSDDDAGAAIFMSHLVLFRIKSTAVDDAMTIAGIAIRHTEKFLPVVGVEYGIDHSFELIETSDRIQG